jgi:hypothetical protein
VKSAVRERAKSFLYGLSDRLCACPLTFELGNWVGELGWQLRSPE